VTLAKPGVQVAWLDDVVFVVQGGGSGAEIVTYPVDFKGKTDPISTAPVCDSLGYLSAGPARAYYRPQNNATVCGTNLYSCDTSLSCVSTTHDIGTYHINGAVVVGPSFYFSTAEGSISRIYMAALSPEGVPAEGNKTTMVQSMATNGLGASLISYDPVRHALWWTTYDGCVYTAGITPITIMEASCFPQMVPKPLNLLISPNDKIYVGSLDGGIYSINPDAAMLENAPSFGPIPGATLKAVDGDYVFAHDPAGLGSLVALRHGTGEERARITETGSVVSADARHPTYTFFIAGNTLYRWRKPP
jgi:hypothetical protein